MPWIIIAIIAVILLLWGIGTYNSLMSKKLSCEEGFSTMDVYLKKRYDLIPNLVETVKGYAAHEKETLERTISARNAIASANTPEARLDAENALSSTLGHLFAVAEAYPDLKANVNFMDLQQQLKGIEGEIANSRKYYNGVVRSYNTKCAVIPSNIIAALCGFKSKPLFEIGAEQRENVKVQF